MKDHVELFMAVLLVTLKVLSTVDNIKYTEKMQPWFSHELWLELKGRLTIAKLRKNSGWFRRNKTIMSHVCCFWNSLTIIFPNWISRLLLSLSMPFRASQLQVCFKFFANTAIKAKLPNLYWLTLVFRWEIEQIAHLTLLTTRTNVWGKLKNQQFGKVGVFF